MLTPSQTAGGALASFAASSPLTSIGVLPLFLRARADGSEDSESDQDTGDVPRGVDEDALDRDEVYTDAVVDPSPS